MSIHPIMAKLASKLQRTDLPAMKPGDNPLAGVSTTRTLRENVNLGL